MHVILTGATGLVGAGALHHMLGNESISRISILSRRPVALAEGHEDKAKVIIHKDFKEYDAALLDQLKDAHGVVWALGCSQNAVGKEEYFDITYEYPLAAAKAFSTLHPETPFNFVLVSGEGATQNPGRFTPLFGKVKGQIEQALYDLGKQHQNLKVFNVRPAGVDWRQHPEIHPFIPKTEVWRRPLLAVLDVAYKSMVTPTRDLGRILTQLAAGDGKPIEGQDVEMGGRVISNVAIRRLAGL